MMSVSSRQSVIESPLSFVDFAEFRGTGCGHCADIDISAVPGGSMAWVKPRVTDDGDKRFVACYRGPALFDSDVMDRIPELREGQRRAATKVALPLLLGILVIAAVTSRG